MKVKQIIFNEIIEDGSQVDNILEFLVLALEPAHKKKIKLRVIIEELELSKIIPE